MLQSRKKIFGLQNGLKRLFCITIEAGIDIDVKIFQNFMILMSYIVMDINCSIHLHMNFWSHEFVNESLATVPMVEKSSHNTVSYLSTFEWYRAISSPSFNITFNVIIQSHHVYLIAWIISWSHSVTFFSNMSVRSSF